jgi:hypothetical protein
MIKTLAWKLDEKSKKEVELHQLNLDLQEALRRVKNFSGTGVWEVKRGRSMCAVEA